MQKKSKNNMQKIAEAINMQKQNKSSSYAKVVMQKRNKSNMQKLRKKQLICGSKKNKSQYDERY